MNSRILQALQRTSMEHFNTGFNLYCSFKVDRKKIGVIRYTTTNCNSLYFEFFVSGTPYWGWPVRESIYLDQNLDRLPTPAFMLGGFSNLQFYEFSETNRDPKKFGLIKARMKRKWWFR